MEVRGGFPGENHLAGDIKRNKKDMSRNIQGSTVDESQKLNTQMSINHRVNKRWHIQTMEHSNEKSTNCTNVEEIHKEHVKTKESQTQKMPAVWFHVHPFPKRALRVRTMVIAGVRVTSWGPEWDNWLLRVSPGAG